MTWQGDGDTGGTGGGPDPDDATHTDWSVGSTPPQPPAEPPSPFAPGGPLADDAAPGAQPPAAPEPPAAPAAPPVAPPGTPAGLVPPPGTAPVSPWAPVDPAATWAATPVGGDRYSVPGAPGLVYAGAVPRAAAYIVDAIILGILTSIVSIPFGSTSFDPADPSTLMAGRAGIAVLLTIVIDAVYFILFWTTAGRSTPGMKLFKLQVGDAATGNKLEMASGAKRWLAYGTWLNIVAFVPALAAIGSLVQVAWTLILLFTTASSPTKQGLHDRFAGSAMVRPAGSGNGLAWTCLVLVVILPVILGLLLIPLIFLGGQVSEILSTVGSSV